MDDIKDILSRRADSLGMQKLDVMTEVKLAIVDMLRIEVRVVSYKNGVIKIATEDAAAASELRHAAQDILKEITKRGVEGVRFIAVSVR
ncbi:DUF721 domain-containing protein [bacterium]|nr:DUF721 domain-containing protein [bacterium]